MNNAHPPGEWVGYYTYEGLPQKCPMHLMLQFEQGRINGAGIDNPGEFVIHGSYDDSSKRVAMAKQYIGKHSVKYEATFQRDEICGTWSLTQDGRTLQGQFRVWPLPDGLYGDDEFLPSILEREIHRKG